MNRFLALLLVVTLVLAACPQSSQASLAVFIPGFDPDKVGGADPSFTLASVDLNPGNSLSVGAIPVSVGGTFTLLYHASVASFLNQSGVAQPGLDIGVTYEYTLVAGFEERVTNIVDNGDGTATATFAMTGAAGSWYELWYDDLTDVSGLAANMLTGEGFRDGELVLSADAKSGTTDFKTQLGTAVQFDNFPGNDYGTQQTVVGSGSANDLVFQINGANTDFFTLGLPGGAPELHLSLFDTQVSVPFAQTNPSDGFYDTDSGLTAASGVTGVYTPNRALGAELVGAGTGASTLGAVNGGPLGGPDLQLQTDGTFSFAVVPEPTAFAVWAVGIAGAFVVGAVRQVRLRRHANH